MAELSARDPISKDTEQPAREMEEEEGPTTVRQPESLTFAHPLRQMCDDNDAVDRWFAVFSTKHILGRFRSTIRSSAHYEHNDVVAMKRADFPDDEKASLITGQIDGIWTVRKHTWSEQSRDLKSVVLVLGLLSASCQGWYQSVVASTLYYQITDERFGFNKLTRDFVRNYRGFGFNATQLRDDFPNSVGGMTDDELKRVLFADLWRVGGLIAAPSLAAALSWLVADPLQHHYLGRRGAITFSAIVMTVATIILMAKKDYSAAIAVRVFVGLSLGAKASIMEPFISELSPPSFRGRCLSTWQIGVSMGVLFGFICWYEVAQRIEPHTTSNELLWKLLSALPLLTTVPLIFTTYMVPESYLFLLKTCKDEKAAESAIAYAPSSIIGGVNLINSHLHMEMEMKNTKDPTRVKCDQEESADSKVANPDTKDDPTKADHNGEKPFRARARKSSQILINGIKDAKTELKKSPHPCNHKYQMRSSSFGRRIWKVVTDPRCCRALLSCGTLMVVQALCGINAFAFFASLQVPHEQEGNQQDHSPPWNSPPSWALCFGVFNFVCSLITIPLTDKIGRTVLALIGLPILSLLDFILAGVFAMPVSEHRNIVTWVLMLMFTAIYSFTLGPAAFSLAAESFPTSVREAGMSLCVALNMLSLGLMLLLYPRISIGSSYTTSLIIFGVITLVGFVACLLWCVDTNDRSLDDLQLNFEALTTKHMRYRLTYVLPKAFSQLIRGELPTIDPFDEWDERPAWIANADTPEIASPQV